MFVIGGLYWLVHTMFSEKPSVSSVVIRGEQAYGQMAL